MHLPKRHLSKHHRARLIALALAMLLWLTSVLCAGAAFTNRHERQRRPSTSLTALARMVKFLIISRAGDFARQRQSKRRTIMYRGRTVARPGLIRALIGARVRRALKCKCIGARISALIHALVHLDAFAAIVAKRMKRRLTRLITILTAPSAAISAPTLAIAPAFCADTS